MKAGDRVLININGDSHHCDVIASESKSVLILINEDGEQIATIQQFWRSEKNNEPRKEHSSLSGSMVERVCAARGCGNVYEAKKSDIKRGWGLCCSKSCAASYRSQK